MGVRKMLSQWSLLPVMVLARPDIGPHLDSVQDNWSQYRAIVNDGGFLYNDSFIVVNDYDTSPDGSPTETNDNPSLNNLNQPLPKLGFENTLMGMVNALQEIQSKGDQMMTAITDQKAVLVKLRSEVDLAEAKLEETVRVTADMELKRSEAEREIKTAERNTRMMSERKNEISAELESLQLDREASLQKLQTLKEELRKVNQEMAEVSKLRSSLSPLETNFQSRQIELDKLEKSLDLKTAELSQVKQQIVTSTAILDEIKTSIASSPNQAEDKLSEQAPSPYLVPALVVSVLLNLLTGGAIINNYIAPTERTDDAGEPLQFIGESLYEEIFKPAGRSDAIVEDNDKMDRNEGTLTYIEAEPAQNTEMKYRDMYVQGQDVYYDLPRYLNY